MVVKGLGCVRLHECLVEKTRLTQGVGHSAHQQRLGGCTGACPRGHGRAAAAAAVGIVVGQLGSRGVRIVESSSLVCTMVTVHVLLSSERAWLPDWGMLDPPAVA